MLPAVQNAEHAAVTEKLQLIAEVAAAKVNAEHAVAKDKYLKMAVILNVQHAAATENVNLAAVTAVRAKHVQHAAVTVLAAHQQNAAVVKVVVQLRLQQK